ncbi:glyoxalase [Pontibacillus halophilus JSM 076056 = DSM 19796]|uniref:Glyoxalase n=1 Tax=Pontibacillus halophilus JSM 076056 = DSM 19796 TaxID=1385510 RepID=A0A0A5GFH0_9BACI|nr:glyoxalase [Pontibacillus halophilus]KGX91961.1 glyoxalase [Pontibacillus halophilus JSM 076056 = DSM 19796]
MSFLIKGIDHVQVAAPEGSEEAARLFYGEQLGLPEMDKPEALKRNGGVWFQCGMHELHIGVEATFTSARKAHPAIEVEEIEALMEHLENVHISYRVDESIPGVKRIYVHDPFDNRLEFIQRN